MREIKLSGRERSVLRAIDFSTGTVGQEILERTCLEPEDLVDTLNALLSIGYAEAVPYVDGTTVEAFRTSTFEVNPSFALELREAIARM